jgi:hypothetical protein
VACFNAISVRTAVVASVVLLLLRFAAAVVAGVAVDHWCWALYEKTKSKAKKMKKKKKKE